MGGEGGCDALCAGTWVVGRRDQNGRRRPNIMFMCRSGVFFLFFSGGRRKGAGTVCVVCVKKTSQWKRSGVTLRSFFDVIGRTSFGDVFVTLP